MLTYLLFGIITFSAVSSASTKSVLTVDSYASIFRSAKLVHNNLPEQQNGIPFFTQGDVVKFIHRSASAPSADFTECGIIIHRAFVLLQSNSHVNHFTYFFYVRSLPRDPPAA